MNNLKPILVGLTGGIGSGKSTVANFFKILGIPVYAADERAKWLMSNDESLKQKIMEAFGAQSFSDGHLNRGYLASQIFTDPEKVKAINSLVHPVVKLDFESWVQNQDSNYVIKEAALLFESGSYVDFEKIINVSSPLKIRLSRVLIRDSHRTEKLVNEIIDQQLPDEIKNQKADYVIKNTENQLLIPQILKIHEVLMKN